MAKDVIMPALGMAQETGTLMRWLKAPGDTVARGEPLMEVETDKATVEVEAPASGVLADVVAEPGAVVPVGQRIARILAPGESAAPKPAAPPPPKAPLSATPTAARIAAEHKLDLAQIRPQGGRVQKDDVLSFLNARPANRRAPASPKARRLAQERGLELASIPGSGPEGAVLAADVLGLLPPPSAPEPQPEPAAAGLPRLWQVMVERLSQAWTSIPHFYLLREADASGLIAWRNELEQRAAARQGPQQAKITYTDLLVKVVAAALARHPRLNASWRDGDLILHPEINIGLAVAVEDGLVVPVIHRADTLGLGQIAARRADLVARAQAGKLAPADLGGGTFTISNLGMYGVDAFSAIVNPPQAAILAVGRIAERVVPLNGQPAVRPTISLSLSGDHRAVDGARAAQFLQTVAEFIEHPMRMLD